MEKVYLKPTAQEINHPTTEPGLFADSFIYESTGDNTRPLGNLYLTGQVKSTGEDASYALNLLASLAKREYYSETGTPGDDPKLAFDSTLKKLNDVLEDFFKKDGFTLNLGLMAIAGEQIHLSRLGKFKVMLARGGELVDILNNLELFKKATEGEHQFSNIISGKIKEGDKIFAFCPTRQTSTREKSFKTLLVDNDQEKFVAGLAAIGTTAKNFQCSGIHLEISKERESKPAIRSIYQLGEVVLANEPANVTAEPTPVVTAPIATPKPKVVAPIEPVEPAPTPEVLEPEPAKTELPAEQTKAISADIAIAKRRSFPRIADLTALPKYSLANLKGGRYVKYIKPGLMGLAVVAILVGVKVFWPNHDPNQAVITQGEENLKLAQGEIDNNNIIHARELLGSALGAMPVSGSDKLIAIKNQLNTLLDRVDLVSDRQPIAWVTIPQATDQIAVIEDGSVAALTKERKVLRVSQSGVSEAGTLTSPDTSGNLFADKQSAALYNGGAEIFSTSWQTKQSKTYKLADASTWQDSFVYQGNLYVISDSAIYKYADAVTGNSQKQTWLGGLTNDQPRALAVDGNIYVLTKTNQVVKYYKSKEVGRITLATGQLADSIEFLTSADTTSYYLVDYSARRIRAFSKTDGQLITTYKADTLSTVKDSALNSKTLYLLSDDNKVWQLAVE